jgi:hypothetical protein
LHKHHHRPKERERFYLLPGMGRSASKRKRKVFLRWSLLTGVAVSALLAYFLYSLGRR